jgi:hypothetical protein
MAEKNIVMDRAEMLIAVHGITQAEIDAADAGGFVGERTVDGVGVVKYFITQRGDVEIPNQIGDRA